MRAWTKRVGLYLTSTAALVAASAAAQQTPPAEGNTESQNRTGPRLVVSPEVWDFGLKLSGEPAEGEVEISNIGDEPAKFSIRSSCGCAAVAQLTAAERLEGDEFQYSLAPGKSDKLKITYNTKKNAKDVNQTITISTNEPGRTALLVAVKGKVTQLFTMKNENAEVDRVQFGRLVRDAESTRTITMTNSQEEPVALKLRPPGEGPFIVTVEEVVAGKEYTLTVRTRPPLPYGAATMDLVFETSHPSLKEFKVPVSAYVQARVTLSRPVLPVASTSMAPITQRLKLMYSPDQPTRILGFESDPLNLISAKVLPTTPPVTATGQASYDIEVNIPPANQLPKEGATLTVLTDDVEPEFQKLQVRVNVVARRAPVRAGAPGATPRQNPAVQPPKPAENQGGDESSKSAPADESEKKPDEDGR
jgi:hypothetical protein